MVLTFWLNDKCESILNLYFALPLAAVSLDAAKSIDVLTLFMCVPGYLVLG